MVPTCSRKPPGVGPAYVDLYSCRILEQRHLLGWDEFEFERRRRRVCRGRPATSISSQLQDRRRRRPVSVLHVINKLYSVMHCDSLTIREWVTGRIRRWLEASKAERTYCSAKDEAYHYALFTPSLIKRDEMLDHSNENAALRRRFGKWDENASEASFSYKGSFVGRCGCCHKMPHLKRQHLRPEQCPQRSRMNCQSSQA